MNLPFVHTICFELSKQIVVILRKTPLSSLCSAQSEFSSAARPFRAHHIYARRIHLSCISKSFCKQGCANAKARFCWREKLFYLAFLGELSPAKCQDSGRHRPSKRFQRFLRRFLPLFAPFKGTLIILWAKIHPLPQSRKYTATWVRFLRSAVLKRAINY